MAGVRGLGAWRWLFFIEGSATVSDSPSILDSIGLTQQVVIAFSAYFIMPNFPRTTRWLSEEERAMAIWRLEEDIGADDWVSSEQQTMLHGFWLAAK